jgi:hypothetical protein
LAPPVASAPAARVTGEWSLIDNETWLAYQDDAARWAGEASKVCSATITGSWKAESFRLHMAELTKDPWGRNRCQRAFEAVADVCAQGKLQKETLDKKLKSVECVWGADGKGGAVLQSQKLVVTIDTSKESTTPPYLDMIRKSL